MVEAGIRDPSRANDQISVRSVHSTRKEIRGGGEEKKGFTCWPAVGNVQYSALQSAAAVFFFLL